MLDHAGRRLPRLTSRSRRAKRPEPAVWAPRNNLRQRTVTGAELLLPRAAASPRETLQPAETLNHGVPSARGHMFKVHVARPEDPYRGRPI
jgi:hypothetical protein